MPKIVITEQDLTTAGTYTEDFNVAYIPGFVDDTDTSLTENGEFIGLAPNTPTLFTSVRDFEALCGSHPAVFDSDQEYSDLPASFSAEALPSVQTKMFSKGDSDPSYVMAKELLSKGLNVLYERVNASSSEAEDNTTYQATNTKYSEISSDESKKSEYYVFDSSASYYEKISTSTAPKIFPSVAVGSQVENDVAYYVYDSSTGLYNAIGLGANLIGEFGGIPGPDVDTDGDGVSDAYSTPAEARKYVTRFIYSQTDVQYKFNTEVYTRADSYYKILDTSKAVSELGDGDVELLVQVPSDWTTAYYKNYVQRVAGKYVTVADAEVSGKFSTSSESEPSVVDTSDSEDVIDASFDNVTLYVKKSTSGISIFAMYTALESIYDSGNSFGLADKGNYSVKYLTSGGYPTYEYNNNSIVSKMMNLAEERGDCIAFIDHTDNTDRTLNINTPYSLYAVVKNDQSLADGGEYSTMFTPWATYNRVTSDKNGNEVLESKAFRGSGTFAYLTSLADSVKTNASWLAVSGATRGIVLNLAQNGMTTNIPNGVADSMQPRDGIAVNAITNIKPYGYTIWGNRTLFNNAKNGNLTASSFLNIRNLVCDVKKVCYRAAKKLTFEQNTDVLWVNFKAAISPTLDKMQSGYGISGYKIVRDTEHEKASEKATICAKIYIYPVYAVEDFYITIVLKDDEISVE